MNLKKYAGTLILFAFSFVCLKLSFAETLIQGPIPSGTWTEEGNPYYITNFTEIPVGNELVIQPGVEIYVLPEISLLVYGELYCEGTEEEGILFSSQNLFSRWDGIRLFDGADAVLKYTTIEKAGTERPMSVHGGGISASFSRIEMDHCTIRYNNAKLNGGGIYLRYTDYKITNCIFHNNSCKGSGSAVGHAEGGKGIFSYNLLYDNFASGSAAYCIYFGDRTIDHCTFYNNTSGHIAGDIRIYGPSVGTITNSIFWREVNKYDESIDIVDGRLNANYCCSDDDSLKGEFIQRQDPLFIDPENFDFRLSPESPCINAGDPDFPLDCDNTITDLGALPFQSKND